MDPPALSGFHQKIACSLWERNSGNSESATHIPGKYAARNLRLQHRLGERVGTSNNSAMFHSPRATAGRRSLGRTGEMPADGLRCPFALVRYAPAGGGRETSMGRRQPRQLRTPTISDDPAATRSNPLGGPGPQQQSTNRSEKSLLVKKPNGGQLGVGTKRTRENLVEWMETSPPNRRVNRDPRTRIALLLEPTQPEATLKEIWTTVGGTPQEVVEERGAHADTQLQQYRENLRTSQL
ncbi:hypothetical protein AXG93_815s1440 [Marchantia polymorpha subsp. ruderalis]|uniref:Uncharacterized protein n=1 Tax=Marchantia polymorpha subsp. ruderalis TaxID=1480154 RepID=A0A176W1P6_MARPO|nr:hypothetical protein AXG93_815s1440 [Marchantia polymorpha subsp. ruderalis]